MFHRSSHAERSARPSRSPTTAALAVALFLAVAGQPEISQAQVASGASAPVRADAARAPREIRSVEGITEYALPNGLQLLLVPDDSKPTTTVNLTYRVGSRHEGYGETGMAHLLEHLLFKGSPRHPMVWNEFTKRGLAANGSTWFDRTNYTASFAANADNLRWYIGWLADSMTNSFIARKDLDTEMTVVRNEMEMGENNPDLVLLEKMMATMYQWHNYGKSTIGARADVENVDIPRLQAFYRTYYQPDNATLIVSGKFDAAQVKAWVADSFGRIARPARRLPTLYTLDPAQDGERMVTLRRIGGTPLVFAAYHAVPGPHRDFAAFEMLGQIMGDVPSGRLHRRLTEQRLAAGTFAWTTGLQDPGFILFGAQLPPGGSTDPVVPVLTQTLESVAREPITAEELERARAKWLNAWDKAFTDPEVIGISLSESIAQGDWRLFFLQRDRVRAVTLADVQRVAEQWLVLSNRTKGLYLPTDKPQRAPAPARVDVAAQLEEFRPRAAAARVEAFEATPANIDARTQRFEVGGLRAAVLPKGSRGQAVQAVLTLRFGDEKTLFGHGEVASFTAAMLDKGTAQFNRQQVQDRLDQLQSQVSIAGAAGSLSVRIVSRREQLPAVIGLVGEMLRRPAFPADVLDELKRQTLASLEAQRKEPDAVLANAIARWNNPYPRGDVRHARTFDEIAADVNAVTAEAVQAFHRRFYGTRHAVFGAAGDMDVAAVRQALTQAFGEWVGGEPYVRVPDPLVPPKPQRLVLLTPDKQNASMLVRLPVPLQDTDADYPALLMANHLLGSGGSSRLWRRIRETEGLSYDVRSWISWNAFEPSSTWMASAIFAPQNQPKVEQAFEQELARALRDGFTAQELAEGKRGLLSFRGLSRSQDDNLAAGLATNLHVGRSYAYSGRIDSALQALTLDQVNAALRRYLRPSDLVRGFAGDFKAAP
jgi:zinc protease